MYIPEGAALSRQFVVLMGPISAFFCPHGTAHAEFNCAGDVHETPDLEKKITKTWSVMRVLARQASIDKTNDWFMTSKQDAVVRGSDPP